MGAILLKAGGFLLIICLGYGFKRWGIFTLDDSQFLTKLIMRITLPAAIITGFQGVEISPTLVFITVTALVINLIMIGVALLASRHSPPAEKAFYMINTAGYNIGNFTIPFTQAFFTPSAVIAVYMFDVGNAIMCFGVTYTLACIVSSGAKEFSLKKVAQTLFSSMPFCTYVIMYLLYSLKISLPDGIFTISSMMGSANSFLAMLLIGVLFDIHLKGSDIKNIIKILCCRVGSAIILACIIYFCLPLSESLRQILVIIVFSPILSIAPVYTEKVGYDKTVAAVLNSLAIPVSMVFMTILLILFQI